jgi:hypothetical protein
MAGAAISATTKVTIAVTAMTMRTAPRHAPLFQEGGSRRQHGAGDHGHHDRQEERLGDVEHGDDGDQKQAGQRKGDKLGAADHRRQLDVAIGKRRTLVVAGDQTFTGKDAHNISPRTEASARPLHQGERARGGEVPSRPCEVVLA